MEENNTKDFVDSRRTVKKDKQTSMKRFFNRTMFFVFGSLALTIVLLVIFGILFIIDVNQVATLVMFIVSLASALLSVSIIIVVLHDFNLIFYKELYIKTKANYDAIESRKYHIDFYKDKGILELQNLNRGIENIRENYTNLIAYSKKMNYTDFKFEYIPIYENNVITKESFESNVLNMINISNCYRDAFMIIGFNTKDVDLIPQDDRSKLVRKIMEVFNETDILVGRRTLNSFYVFVPNIDSIHNLKLKFDYLFKNIKFVSYAGDNAKIITLRIDCVIYPYSNSDEIIGDLNSLSKNDEDINVYIPSLGTTEAKFLSTDVERMNNISKLIETFSGISSKALNAKDYENTIFNTLFRMGNYLNYDASGVVLMKDQEKRYFVNQSYHTKDNICFRVGQEVDKSVLDVLNDVKDFDNTYCFYSRLAADERLARIIDVYNIYSGFIYVIYQDNEPYGFIYFFNMNREMLLDNYSRQSLVLYCALLSNVYSQFFNNLKLKSLNTNLDQILKLSGYKLYSVNIEDLKLRYVCESLKDSFDYKIKPGDYSYKALFDLDEPNESIPVLNKGKSIVNIKGKVYRTSVVIDKNTNETASVYLEPIENKDPFVKNEYDRWTFINSCYSLVSDLTNKYSLNSRGYVVFMRIDNYNKIVKNLKENDVIDLLQKFNNDYLDSNSNYKCYLYDSSTFAFILNEKGRNDVFSFVEKIYLLTLKNGKVDKEKGIVPSFFAFNYPLVYQTSFDFLKNAEIQMTGTLPNDESLIYFKDTDLIRPASREKYIIELLQLAFDKNELDYTIIPIVDKVTRKINGGEVLLRLKDEMRNVYINAFEFMNVAIRNNLMTEFSNIIITTVGKIYEKYGTTVLLDNGIDYIGINIDPSYLRSDNLITNLSALMKRYKLPKNFLSFEINEADVDENYQDLSDIFKKIKQLNIRLSCDQYTGSKLSVEKLRERGFDEIKVSLDIVKDIDNNINKLADIKSISNVCYESNMRLTLVGIERSEQLEAIADMNVTSCEGYLFSKPLDIESFLRLLHFGLKE